MTRKHKHWFTLLWIALLLAVLIWMVKSGTEKLEKSLYPQKYASLVEQYAAEYELDPLLVYSVIHTESGFDPMAQSGVDARGLMQIMDETFQWIKSKIAPDEALVFEDLYTPEVNIRFGTYYFSRCMKRYHGDVGTAAAAYHSGWGTVDKLLKNPEYTNDGQILHTFPYKQMGRYVEKIDRAYSKYQEIYSKENEG